MDSHNPKPPADLSTEMIATLEAASDAELRDIIHYAQQLLTDHPTLTDEIKQREGEELVQIDDHGAYTSVVVERPEATGEARGPFVYRVQWEPTIGELGGKYRWHYLGRVNSEAGGE